MLQNYNEKHKKIAKWTSSLIMMSMKWKIRAIEPPKLKKPYAVTLLWILAGVMLAFALLHLIRIDKLIPVITEVLGEAGATWFVVIAVLGEVFALPYLLRMKLSPAFRIKSGLWVLLVPLMWTCLSIWALGNGHSTGQFSSYISLPASWWLIALNLLWLGVSYWVLWLSNFDKCFAALRKKR